MDVVLVPGLWLGAWCWDDVVRVLEGAGQPARPGDLARAVLTGL